VLRLSFLFVCGFFPLVLQANAQNSLPGDLSAHHREWIDKDVVYIISDTERMVFLSLPAEELRDQFIEAFWKHRDPTPATAANEYKEEHYRRIAYANAWYGSRRKGDGWRSDRGRVYILLGEPQERSKYTGQNDIRDCEIWFYHSQERVRDFHVFRLLFYQKDFAQDYVLYSPTADGPEQLVMQIGPTRERALMLLRERFGDELWAAAQSAAMTEPLGGRWSPQTDVILSRIDNLRNTLIDPSWAENFVLTSGRVSARITFRSMRVSLVTRVLFNLNKQAFLHAGLQIQPEEIRVGEIDGRYYAVFNVRTFVEDLKSRREVLASENHWETEFETRQKEILARPIAFSQVLPLVPGRYRVIWVLENEVTQTFSFHEREIEVPPPLVEDPFLTEPLLTARHDVLDREAAFAIEPFRVFNLQYHADFTGSYNQGDSLSVFFEYLYPLPAKSGVQFDVEIVPSDPSSGEPLVLTHLVSSEQFTDDGIRLAHRQIPLDALRPGEYGVTVRATDKSNGKSVSSSSLFTYRGEESLVRARSLFLPTSPRRVSVDYLLERSRQFEVMGRFQEAIEEMALAVGRNPEARQLGARLEELKRKAGAF
jgi:GWxTD domain-containing protein